MQPQHHQPDLFQLLRPRDQPHVAKGTSPLWERRIRKPSHQPQQNTQCQQSPRIPPNRPGTATNSLRSPESLKSPRNTAPAQNTASVANNLPPRRCMSAHATHLQKRSTPLATIFRTPKDVEHKESLVVAQENPRYPLSRDQTFQEAFSSPTCPTSNTVLLPNINSREHVEFKACMLAYMHRINVDELHGIRELSKNEFNTIRAKQLMAKGGYVDDGSQRQMTKHKTEFLLRHFFTLDDTTRSKQDELVCDVVDEWSCLDQASSDKIGSLWKSVVDHIERSYLLRRNLVAKSDPDAMSLVIAMDCLRRLPSYLPEYRRVLDVIIALVETGLYTSTENSISERISSTANTYHRRRFYFEECHELRDTVAQAAEARPRTGDGDSTVKTQRSELTPQQKLQELLSTLDEQDQYGDGSKAKQTLFIDFLREYFELFVPVAWDEIITYFFGPSMGGSGKRSESFYAMWMPRLTTEEALQAIAELCKHHTLAFKRFLHENIDMMDKALIHEDAHGERTTTLFQEMIERHPTHFAAILCQSSYLIAHVFQGSHFLIARILEQNIVLVSQVLHQRSDILLSLLSHTLRENTAVTEEFFLNHPKVFTDLLTNRPAAIAAAVRSNPAILTDLIQSSRPALTQALLSSPDVLGLTFKSTPQLLAQTFRDDKTLLPLVFSLVPHSLADALERHPNLFIDIALRKPALIARLFAKHPDLLLDPLETNPSVFTSFLVQHRNVLPDFSDPKFDPSFFQFERAKYTDSAQQTQKCCFRFHNKLRVQEKIQSQQQFLSMTLRQMMTRLTSAERSSTAKASAIETTGKTMVKALSTDQTTVSIAESKATPKSSNDSICIGATPVDPLCFSHVAIVSPVQVAAEIARIYLKKVETDELNDLNRRNRQPLADFVLDLYIAELGFKSKAHQKLMNLLLGAKCYEKESPRMKWFLRLINSGEDKSMPYHPMASGFYLSALKKLVPREEFLLRLEDEIQQPCLVPHSNVRELIEDPFFSRMMITKEQRQEFMSKLCEKENRIHNGIRGSVNITVLHVDDVLESVMMMWLQHQDKIRAEWSAKFQRVNPDGSGVIRYQLFADLVREGLKSVDDRTIMKLYHSCGEENELGEYYIVANDFALAVSILQEQHEFHSNGLPGVLVTTPTNNPSVVKERVL